MQQPLYELRQIKHLYKSGDLVVPALQGLDMTIEEGKLTCISGPSGSGKSTLLHLMALIEPLQSGKLLFQGRELSRLCEKEKNRIRRFEIGLIFQQFHLFPVLSAEENIAYFLHRQALGRQERLERTERALKQVDLWPQRHKRPSELSGGQQQRVAIARALAKKPRALIADEPTASLDQQTGCQIMQLLLELCRDQETSVIVASHDPMVHAVAHDHWVIRDGLATHCLHDLTTPSAASKGS